jgi:hypothetical protein
MFNEHAKERPKDMTKLLDEVAAAALLGLRPKTLCRWRFEGRGPAYCKIGRTVRYRPPDIEAFISSGMVAQNA